MFVLRGCLVLYYAHLYVKPSCYGILQHKGSLRKATLSCFKALFVIRANVLCCGFGTQPVTLLDSGETCVGWGLVEEVCSEEETIGTQALPSFSLFRR